jgi:hypothetical protein
MKKRRLEPAVTGETACPTMQWNLDVVVLRS